MNQLLEEQSRLATASLAVLAAVAIAGVLYVTKPVMIPFVLAIFIASMVAPLVDFQVLRLRFPHALAVAGGLLAVLAIVAVFLVLVIYAGERMVGTAGRYVSSLSQVTDPIDAMLEKLGMQLKDGGVTAQIRAYVPSVVSHTAATTLSVVTMSFLIVIFVIFLLAGRNPHQIRGGIYAEIDHKIRRYISIKVFLSAITGILVWIILSVLNLELAGVFGLLAFALNFIPSIGSVIATLLPIPVAMAQFGDPWSIVAVIAGPGAVQMAIGNGLEPKLMGNELQLHPVVVLLALSFWGLLWGPLGMLLAVPITAILRIILMRFQTTRPIGDVLAGELPAASTESRTA